MSYRSYPLAWPQGFPRTEVRERARFKTSFEDARRGLGEELARMGVPDFCMILSTNIPLRRDGNPYSDFRQPAADPGVAIYFVKEVDWERGVQERVVLACDRWDRVGDNIQALRLTVEAMRGLERWGCSDMLKRAFSGFASLPAAGETLRTPWQILEVSRFASAEEIKAARNRLARKHHPDAGGAAERMVELNQAFDHAMKEVAR